MIPSSSATSSLNTEIVAQESISASILIFFLPVNKFTDSMGYNAWLID
jgi:hypothetical protein